MPRRSVLGSLLGPFRRTSRATRPGSSSRPRPAPVVPRPGPPAATAQRVLEYTPDLDGAADPGEVVWGWVAYEEDPTQGKDRPVLVVGHDTVGTGAGTAPGTAAATAAGLAAGGSDLVLALMLSSQDYHDGDPAWLPLGSGPWDSEGRPSWVRLDRVLELPADGIRREGAVLDRARFDRVAAALRADHGWS